MVTDSEHMLAELELIKQIITGSTVTQKREKTEVLCVITALTVLAATCKAEKATSGSNTAATVGVQYCRIPHSPSAPRSRVKQGFWDAPGSFRSVHSGKTRMKGIPRSEVRVTSQHGHRVCGKWKARLQFGNGEGFIHPVRVHTTTQRHRSGLREVEAANSTFILGVCAHRDT